MTVPGAGLCSESLGLCPAPIPCQVMDEEAQKARKRKALKLHFAVKAPRGGGHPKAAGKDGAKADTA